MGRSILREGQTIKHNGDHDDRKDRIVRLRDVYVDKPFEHRGDLCLQILLKGHDQSYQEELSKRTFLCQRSNIDPGLLNVKAHQKAWKKSYSLTDYDISRLQGRDDVRNRCHTLSLI
ncbi:hypothetical protein Sa4125_25650 [Aureimonas sp. SA4125]|nr:hypothetical protein Sa4125_25650 [Aureimonas sp. SA4125]